MNRPSSVGAAAGKALRKIINAAGMSFFIVGMVVGILFTWFAGGVLAGVKIIEIPGEDKGEA